MRITLVVTFAGADLVTIKVAYSWSPPSSADPRALACPGTARTRLARTWLARTWLARTWLARTWLARTWLARTWLARTWLARNLAGADLAGADLAAARCRDTSGHCLATFCPNLLTQPT
jgi:hypothetical protein